MKPPSFAGLQELISYSADKRSFIAATACGLIIGLLSTREPARALFGPGPFGCLSEKYILLALGATFMTGAFIGLVVGLIVRPTLSLLLQLLTLFAVFSVLLLVFVLTLEHTWPLLSRFVAFNYQVCVQSLAFIRCIRDSNSTFANAFTSCVTSLPHDPALDVLPLGDVVL